MTYVDIVKGELAAGESFRNAVKTGMVAILCSKSFLFISEGDENADRHQLNDWELATRLSYLLWSTMPDDELFRLAEQGLLHDRTVLQAQFNRLLSDPRSQRFTRSFTRQWLHLRKVGMFPPDRRIYPNYDDHLEKSMIGETQAFFAEVLHKNLTLAGIHRFRLDDVESTAGAISTASPTYRRRSFSTSPQSAARVSSRWAIAHPCL